MQEVKKPKCKLREARKQGLMKLQATFVGVPTDTFAAATAIAEFNDGRVFQESADATPENVHHQLRPHFPRLALTRAKARALRDALGIGQAAYEEMGG